MSRPFDLAGRSGAWLIWSGLSTKSSTLRLSALIGTFAKPDRWMESKEHVWLNPNGAQVCYVDASLSKPLKLVKAIRSTDYDLVYLNSFFEPLFSTLPALLMKIGILKSQPIIMAPRGEFSLGALALKSFKKALFMRFQWLVKLYGGACWQATTELEAENIRRALGNDIRLWTAPNLSAKVPPTLEKRIAKPTGHLNIVFLSRVSPMKNLLALIRSAGRLRGRISLDIWGPIDDAEYWRQCQAAMALSSRQRSCEILWGSPARVSASCR